jgi:hypothetical protein
MTSTKGTYWYCASRDCGFSAVLTLPDETLEAPICLCGALMRKSEPHPVSTYLEFLRCDDALREPARSEKES